MVIYSNITNVVYTQSSLSYKMTKKDITHIYPIRCEINLIYTYALEI